MTLPDFQTQLSDSLSIYQTYFLEKTLSLRKKIKKRNRVFWFQNFLYGGNFEKNLFLSFRNFMTKDFFVQIPEFSDPKILSSCVFEDSERNSEIFLNFLQKRDSFRFLGKMSNFFLPS